MKKYGFFHFLGKTKIKNKCFLFVLKHFFRAFQCRFQNSKMFTSSEYIQQKPQKTKKNHEKIQIFALFWVKNQKIQKCFLFILQRF